jgi:hypothetical protein
MSNVVPGGLQRVGLLVSAAVVSTAAFAQPTHTTAEANKLAYDAYNTETSSTVVTVQGIVVSQPKYYDGTLVPPLAQEGVGFGVMVIQDPTANRVLDGKTYSNAVKVVFGGNYGDIPEGTPFPLSFEDRQTYGFPRNGDLVEVQGYAEVSYGTISAIFPLTRGNEPIIDMRSSTFSQIQVLSEGHMVTPTPVTPSTFAEGVYGRFPHSAIVGVTEVHSRKGIPGFGQGNLNPNPMLGMLVQASGSKYDMFNPKNIQQSYNNGPVGFMLADTNAASFDDAAALFVSTRVSLSTGESPNPIDAGYLSPGSTDPVTGIVCCHLLIAGVDVYNVSGIQCRTQGDVPDAGGPINRVSFTTVQMVGTDPPIPGGEVSITTTALEGNQGEATVTADLMIMGPGGALDSPGGSPITSLLLTPTSPGANTYKGTFAIGVPATHGLLPPALHYQNADTDNYLDTSSAFSPVTNAVPFLSVAALKLVEPSLPDGFPVAVDASIPGTISPIVTLNEADGGAYLSTTGQFWIQDPFAPAGHNVYLPDGNKASPIVYPGDEVSIAGFLLTYYGNREINSRISYVSVESYGNPIPDPVLMNTNHVSTEFHDDTSGQRMPPAAIPNQGVLATVVGKVIASPSALMDDYYGSFVDIDDGTGLIAIKLDNRFTAEPDMADFLAPGDVVIATGVLAGNTSYATGGVVRSLWIRNTPDIIKNPTLGLVNVTAANNQLVTLPAPPNPTLLGAPSIIPFPIARLFDGSLYTGPPAADDPWWKGLEFLQLGEAYQIVGTPTDFSYYGLTSGTGLDIEGNVQAFDLEPLPRYYALFNSPGSQQLAGIPYVSTTVQWNDSGPSAFWGFDGGSLQNKFGAVSTTIDSLANEAGGAITSPYTFNPDESFRATTKGEAAALVMYPQARGGSCSLTVEVDLEPAYGGSVSGLPVRAEVRCPGSTVPLKTVNTFLNASGRFTVSNVPYGLYDLWVKPCGFLAGKIAYLPVGPCVGGVLLVDGPGHFGLKTGDTNDDNAVDLTDLNEVLLAFGQPGTCPLDADGSGTIDLGDLNAVMVNFGKVGE